MTATSDVGVGLTFCGLVVGRREDQTAWEPCRRQGVWYRDTTGIHHVLVRDERGGGVGGECEVFYRGGPSDRELLHQNIQWGRKRHTI